MPEFAAAAVPSAPALRLWPCEIAALDPPDETSVSEWANANIVLLPESSPREPGPYRWQRTPYCSASRHHLSYCL